MLRSCNSKLEIEKPRSDVTASEQGTEQKHAQSAFICSDIEFNTQLNPPASILMDYLHCGAENAIPAKTLAAIVCNGDDRRLRHQVTLERSRGVLILSNAKGYYLPDEGEKGMREIADYHRIMQARIASTFRAIYYARKALNNLSGQQKIEDI